MNQRQIRYLEKRSQDEEGRLAKELSHKHTESRKAALEKTVEDFQKAYRERLSLLPKDEIVDRFMLVVSGACRHYNDYGSYSRDGVIDLTEKYCSFNLKAGVTPEDVIEIDRFVCEWNRKIGRLEEDLLEKERLEKERLQDEARRLRDRINLGDASEAARSLEEFVLKWTKIIDDAEKEDVPQKPRKSAGKRK